MNCFISPESLCQIEILVSDLSSSIRYFEEVFGWKRVPAYIHNLCILDVKNSKIGVSLIPVGSALTAGQKLTLYFQVESEKEIKRMMETSERLSGRKGPKYKHLPSYGKVFYICSKDGHKFGLFLGE